MKINTVPADFMAGLRQNWKKDLGAGFVVFLLALPLSLGIAKAADIPPVMGLVSAIIGGMVVSLISGSRLTIKGPAAGLIVIVAGAVADFGGGADGWKMMAAALVIAGILQILLGVFKLGRYVDFFPLSAIHGMLAAIGIIIIAKQIPILLDIDPAELKGHSVFELLASVPSYIRHLDPKASFIGLVSMAILILWPKLKLNALRSIPAPLIVLLFAIPTEVFMDFEHTEPPYALVHIGNLFESVRFNADFGAVSQTGVFIKYVMMFLIVGSLESLLTVKAIDLLDPYKRKSDTNKDLIAVGVGNTLTALLGGYPMIAEVARSSANVNQGAQTRWANFFHGFFMLTFLLLAVHLIELIPNAALAAMLIMVGYKLAHPKAFIHTFAIGAEQLAIFLVTIFFTLFEDLLVGILAGILLKIIIEMARGVSLKSILKAPIQVSFTEQQYVVSIYDTANFTNLIRLKKKLKEVPFGFELIINLEGTKLVDHTVMEELHHFKMEYEEHGGNVIVKGLDKFQPVSKHALSSRVLKKDKK